MVKSRRRLNRLFPACIGLAALVMQFLSCGLEEYYYLPSLQEAGGRVEISLNNLARIQLPNISTSASGYYYFRHFTIFYRMYVSSQNDSGQIQISDSELRRINSSLATDYAAIFPSTDDNTSTTSSSTAVGSLFQNRRYYELALTGGDIKNVLDTPGRTLELEFPPNPGIVPTLTIGGASYTLFRSNGEGIFAPVPDRYFLNSAELHKSENAVPQKNADVADNTSLTSDTRYTFISLYITLEGIDERTFSPIYSRPTFIGILRLPEAN